jgi:hypothetical protein
VPNERWVLKMAPKKLGSRFYWLASKRISWCIRTSLRAETSRYR